MKFKFGLKYRQMLGLMLLMSFLYFVSCSIQYPISRKTHITITSGQTGLITKIIQKAIDSCAANGGGTVLFPAGTYLTGGIQLKSNVTLQLDKGAILQGSDKYTDYKNDAFIYGKDLSNIAIQGEGTIDGVNCYNPKGEEGFRGPHCIRLINCKNISLKGFTIINSANWAINCRYSSYATVENVSIRGGHDGLHTRFCNDFTVTGCDFRTGDDAFAGNDNRNFLITDCKINTSCNAFRMGCYNLTVKRCHLWGPGESIHKIQKRNNMLAAFVHFSPKDENPKLLSGNWLIQDVTVDRVDNFYNYNYENGLWQTGQPVTSIRFENIKATEILNAFTINGDRKRQLELTIKNSSFSFREGTNVKNVNFEGAKSTSNAFFNAANFDVIDLNNVILQKATNNALLEGISGNKIVINGVHIKPDSTSSPYLFTDIIKIIR